MWLESEMPHQPTMAIDPRRHALRTLAQFLTRHGPGVRQDSLPGVDPDGLPTGSAEHHRRPGDATLQGPSLSSLHSTPNLT
jgi:hypothetical protein